MQNFKKERDLYLNNPNQKILLFDLFSTGHHSGYILYLVKYWQEKNLPGSLDILVTPKFMQLHPDIVNLALDCSQRNINFIGISPEEEAYLKPEESSFDRIIRSFQEWKLLYKYAILLKSSQCLIMYFDSIMMSLAFMPRLPCLLSGIYFRPIFHYDNFVGFTPSRHERFLQLRDKFTLPRILRNSRFQTLFCLDPCVVESIDNIFNEQVKAIHLPDPVQIYGNSISQVEKLRENLKIKPDRKVFLMFGVSQKRKGIYELLDAIALLPSHLSQKFCLLLVGSIASEPLLQTRITELSDSLPIQIIVHKQFVPEPEIQLYFQASDVILAPYQRHIGMSGILVRAAAAQKPVLSSNYGLMGEIARRYKLGITVDSGKPSEITKGLTQFLLESPTEFCDYRSMKSFAEQNSAEKFASTIFNYLYI